MNSIYRSIAILFMLLTLPIIATAAICDTNESIDAQTYFNDKAYERAFPLLEDEAKKGVKSSMYQVAHMYENGLGVQQSSEKALYWFKKAASTYSYTLSTPTGNKDVEQSFAQRIGNQINPSTNKKGDAFALSKLDTDTPETKALLGAFLNNGFFGLKPYATNFVIPVAYTTNRYRHIASDTHYSNYTPVQLDKYGLYDQKTEVQFQFSFRKPLTFNLFGLNESVNFAYTQKVWWQLYSDSAPFRETNYLPEMFIMIPTSKIVDDRSGLKALKLGYIHESNGQEGYRSRSWNRLYATGMWQWRDLFVATRLWYRLSEDEKYSGYYDGAVNPDTGEFDPNTSGDDNPNIEDYLGYGDIKLNYLYGRHQFGSLLRYNFGSGGKHRGAVDFHWSYPFLNSENTFWYIKLFSGYGESLIDYDQSVTKAAFGFSFSRALF